MALKKPSDYFTKKEIPSVSNAVQELEKSPELNTFSDAFQAFKNNLDKIEILSNFSETLDNYRVNIERVNHISEKVEDIQSEIQTLLKKEDLDNAMMSQLLVVEQSIQEVQSKVKGINEKNLTEIRLDVSGLTGSVNEFLEIEVPKYKKVVIDSEIRVDTRISQFEEDVNQTLEGIGEFVDNKYQELTESLQGINEKSLASILEDFKILENNLQKICEEDIPKYKGFIVETERKVDVKLGDISKLFGENVESVESSFEKKVKQIQESLCKFDELTEQKIENIQKTLNEFIQVEAPKYNKLLIENKLKTEEEVKVLQENISKKVSQFVEDIETLKNTALKESNNISSFVTEKIEEFKTTLSETQKDVKKTLSTYTSISKTFENKITKDNERIDICENTLNDYSQKIEECLSQILVFKEDVGIQQEIENEWKKEIKDEFLDKFEYYQQLLEKESNLNIELGEKLKEEFSYKFQEQQSAIDIGIVALEEELNKKVSDLHIEVVRNETHIKVQNKNLQAIQEEVRETLGKINLEEFEEKSYKLGEKIKYLEEVFEKFNEKEILTETLLVEPPSVDNSDPLTPLDQKFVTLDQLQEHYRLFLNRIQQQLSTLGGGGETRLKYLDDIVGIATNPAVYDGKVLSYNHSIGKFEFITGGGGGNAAITISDTPPLDPQPGNLWYDSTIGRTFIYYEDVDGAQWVDASPSGLFGNWTYTNTETITQTKVGIGTTTISLPSSKMEVYGGDMRVGINTSQGLVMTSPNGTNYRLIVNNDGTLTTAAL